MSDNDFTSGDPWGLSSTGTDQAPPAPPPVPDRVSDELPEDLADLSTIADGDIDTPMPDVDGAVEEALESVSSDADPVDAESVTAEIGDDGTDLDLGDFGNFSDLAADNDLGPLEISNLSAVSEASAPTEEADDALSDLSSLTAELTEVTNDKASETPGSQSASRPLNPLLAASGLFGGSPSLPPLSGATQEDDDGDTADDDGGTDDSDAPIQVGDGDIDFDAIELSGAADLVDFDLPDGAADGLDIEEPADLEAELADTLSALGDQSADSITFDSDVPLMGGDDEETIVADDPDDALTEQADEASAMQDTADETIEADDADRADEDVEAAEAENFYPEFMSVASDESDSSDSDADEAEIGFEEPDFMATNTPPAVYHELENLGGDDGANAPDDEKQDAESESEFGAIFGGSKASPDDPFGAVFGSGDDAIDAVAAAASSIEMTHPSGQIEPPDTPTVDDLPDFLMDDDVNEHDSDDLTNDVSPDPSEVADPDESDDSTAAAGDETPSGWLGFGESSATSDDLATVTDEIEDDEEDDEEAIDDDLADDEIGISFGGAEDTEDAGEADEDAVRSDEAVAFGAPEEPATGDDTNETEGAIDPLPPMRDATPPPPFDADPFATPAIDDRMKVDSTDLDAAAMLGVAGLAASTEPADEDHTSDEPASGEEVDAAEVPDAPPAPGGPGHAPIIGTIATGVIEKKPIPEDWGTRSDDAYEGWVQDDDGVETWRMIITNLPTVAGYDIDEFLGLAVADSLVVSHDVEAVASGRRAAIDALTEDGVLRGAHAIVAVTHAVQAMGSQMLVTVSGTAVTLKPTATAQAD